MVRLGRASASLGRGPAHSPSEVHAMVTLMIKFDIGHVVAAGIIGGVLFAAFEMLGAMMLTGSHASSCYSG
jgi:hypothetical protein